jgi:hypothetical protein
MEPVDIYYNTGVGTYLKRKKPFYNLHKIQEQFEICRTREIISTGKVFYCDSQFPRKMARGAGYTTVSDVNNADIIILPPKFIHDYDELVHCVEDEDNDKYVICNRPFISAPFVKYDHDRWLKYIDDPRTISACSFYRHCRKMLPVLTKDEIASLRELLKSPDRDIQRTAAYTVLNSSFPDDIPKISLADIYLKAKYLLRSQKRHQEVAAFCLYA